MILGVDPGGRRYGLAAADDVTRIARPLEVIDSDSTDVIERIVKVANELEVRAIVVGKPTSLSGREGPAVEAQRGFVARLKEATGIPIVEHDERLTTVVAEQGMRAAGGKAQARAGIRDAVAAQVMLQGYLDSEAPA